MVEDGSLPRCTTIVVAACAAAGGSTAARAAPRKVVEVRTRPVRFVVGMVAGAYTGGRPTNPARAPCRSEGRMYGPQRRRRVTTRRRDRSRNDGREARR